MDEKLSFEEILERSHPGILRYLSRLVGEDETEDVAIEEWRPFRRTSSIK